MLGTSDLQVTDCLPLAPAEGVGGSPVGPHPLPGGSDAILGGPGQDGPPGRTLVDVGVSSGGAGTLHIGAGVRMTAETRNSGILLKGEFRKAEGRRQKEGRRKTLGSQRKSQGLLDGSGDHGERFHVDLAEQREETTNISSHSFSYFCFPSCFSRNQTLERKTAADAKTQLMFISFCGEEVAVHAWPTTSWRRWQLHA